MLTFNDFNAGGGGGGVGGSGNVPYLPIWSAATTLGDSKLSNQDFYQTPLSNVYDPLYLTIESPYVSIYNYDPVNTGGGYEIHSNSSGITDYYGGIYLAENNGGFDNFNIYYFRSGGGSLQLLYIDQIANAPLRQFRIIEGGYTFLDHRADTDYHRTLIFGGENNNSIPDVTGSNYALYVTNASTISGLTFSGGNFNGTIQVKNYWRLFNNNTFQSANVVSGQLISNELQLWGGTTTINQALTGLRTWSQLALFPQFAPVSGASVVTDVSGLQILGLYATSVGFGSVTVNNYYSLLINDTNEYNFANITVTNRWAIYQAGANDRVQFFGLMGFYGATPIVQQNTGIAAAAFVHNAGGTNIKTVDTILGYTLAQVVQALKNYGLLA